MDAPPPRVEVVRAVAPGGVVSVSGRGFALPAQITVDGRVVGRIRRPGGDVRFRAPRQPQRLVVRGEGADGRRTPRRAVRVRYLRLSAVGDINLSQVPAPRYPWTSVGRRLRAADLAFGNLETAVSRRGRAVQKQFTFRAPPARLRGAARHGGLDVVNLANNHAGDFGDTALMDTVRAARRFGIATVGAGRDAAAAYRPLVVRRLGLRVAFVGFSSVLPFAFQAGRSDPGTAWAHPDRIARGVRRARRRADVVIATFHWGIEGDFRESANQRALARLALRNGATAVIGAHPHVLQPVVRRGRRLVAYSLGNFVFTPVRPGSERTGILELRLGAGRVAGSRLRRATIVGSRPTLP